jgi:Transcriptional regulatory protein, C terminal
MTAASTPDLQPCGGRQIMFGSFRLYPDQRVLLRADTPVRLGGRALEILIALVERAGKIVRKADLTARVWPDTFVEEGTLRVHIAKLRNALREGQHCVHYVERPLLMWLHSVAGSIPDDVKRRLARQLSCMVPVAKFRTRLPRQTKTPLQQRRRAGQALPPTNSDS